MFNIYVFTICFVTFSGGLYYYRLIQRKPHFSPSLMHTGIAALAWTLLTPLAIDGFFPEAPDYVYKLANSILWAIVCIATIDILFHAWLIFLKRTKGFFSEEYTGPTHGFTLTLIPYTQQIVFESDHNQPWSEDSQRLCAKKLNEKFRKFYPKHVSFQ